eukprot:jgi/Bigna1/127906/aug1.5_g2614
MVVMMMMMMIDALICRDSESELHDPLRESLKFRSIPARCRQAQVSPAMNTKQGIASGIGLYEAIKQTEVITDDTPDLMSWPSKKKEKKKKKKKKKKEEEGEEDETYYKEEDACMLHREKFYRSFPTRGGG